MRHDCDPAQISTVQDWLKSTKEFEAVLDVVNPEIESFESVLIDTGLTDLVTFNPCSEISPITQAIVSQTLKLIHEKREGGIMGRISKQSVGDFVGMAARSLYSPKDGSVTLPENLLIINDIMAANKILQDRLPNVRNSSIGMRTVDLPVVNTDNWVED